MPPPSKISRLDGPLDEAPLRSLDARGRAALGQLGLATPGLVAAHYPRRHEDRTRFDRFPTHAMDSALCLHGMVVDLGTRFLGGKRRFVEATVEDPSGLPMAGRLVLRWFNMPYIAKLLAVGQELILYGKVKQSGRRLAMDHPDFEIVESGGTAGQIHMERLVPIYPLTSGLQQRQLRAFVHETLVSLEDGDFPDLIPPHLSKTLGRPIHRAWAVREAHFPASWESLKIARRFLALEEFTALQVHLLLRRAEYERLGRGAMHCGPGLLLERCLASLPYEPTGAQTRAIGEIRADLASEKPMNRLLQGDVGSGKTLVATAALLLAVEAGFQGALMAPTQILAEQHYQNLRTLLEPLGLRVSLRASGRREDGFDPLFQGGDSPQIVVGTHALLHGAEEFEKLGLVVIDEQHRFGVKERSRLISQGQTPDVLVMTATPIPRTLALSVHGDLDVSSLDEMPRGRQRIATGIRDLAKLEAAAGFIREQLEAGRQAYIVYPLVEESEKVKSQAATAEFARWEKRLAGHACGLLHGKLAAEEKERVMRDFRDGRLRALIATTVIEVGVDVPNANVILIMNAERFGLAQLHQLRGRVGRGSHKSYCILMCGEDATGARERLSILEQSGDGFRIAEADLEQRGPGDLLGTAQAGLPDLNFPEFLAEGRVVQRARTLALEIVRDDPRLEKPAHQALARRFTRQGGAEAAAGQLS